MDTRQEVRVAHDESLFRAANERNVKAALKFEDQAPARVEIMCECAVTECEDMIVVPTDDYKSVRKNPRAFIVKPDHVIAASETTLRTEAGFWVVEKVGAGADEAEQMA